MITKINIDNFGVFRNYNWNTSVGRNTTFRRVNVIYGRNYSGKTTFSRILRCIEEQSIHNDFDNCKFEIICDNKEIVTPSALTLKYKMRVYNSDFIKKHLGWLHNEDGTIQPFAILGEENIEIESQISAINTKLGNIESKEGLLFEFESLKSKIDDLTLSNNLEESEITSLLSGIANNQIKTNSTLFQANNQKKTYIISDIRSEIGIIIDDIAAYILSDQDTHKKEVTVKENIKKEINLYSPIELNLTKNISKTISLLSRKIAPSQAIESLVNNSILEQWVRQGIEHHRSDKSICKFCENPISDELWQKLDKHFTMEFENLRKEIKTLSNELKDSISYFSSFTSISVDQVYNHLSSDLEGALLNWSNIKEKYVSQVQSLKSALELRFNDIYNSSYTIVAEDCSDEVLKCFNDINRIIRNHNDSTLTIADTQDAARRDLRLSHIAKMILNNSLINKFKYLADSKKNKETLFEEMQQHKKKIDDLFELKRALEGQLQDESKGAALVNRYLSHFFGHDELTIITITESNNSQFRVQRHGSEAKNLSEGESRLISFCYFIAKIDNEMNDRNNELKPIIYIDDPISSLDSNHVFFVFSLIESIITSRKNYLQLFISTHNLDFLKYLRNLTIPRYKPEPTSKTEVQDIEHFIINRKTGSSSVLELAPKYLKEYITEFNYLFKSIYACGYENSSIIGPEYLYNFGNNTRKFLEAFLFFKYPSHNMSFGKRLQLFFGSDTISYSLVNRATNEYSHLEQRLDRGMEPIDLAEAQSISQKIIQRIHFLDGCQLNALLDSIGITEFPPKSSTSSPS